MVSQCRDYERRGGRGKERMWRGLAGSVQTHPPSQLDGPVPWVVRLPVVSPSGLRLANAQVSPAWKTISWRKNVLGPKSSIIALGEASEVSARC